MNSFSAIDVFVPALRCNVENPKPGFARVIPWAGKIDLLIAESNLKDVAAEYFQQRPKRPLRERHVSSGQHLVDSLKPTLELFLQDSVRVCLSVHNQSRGTHVR